MGNHCFFYVIMKVKREENSMKVYEYAKLRGIKSRDIVRKCHELGIFTVKNHLSLIPLKRLPDLDAVTFQSLNKEQGEEMIAILSFDLTENNQKVDKILSRLRDRASIILPLTTKREGLTVEMRFDVHLRSKWNNVVVYKKVEKEVEYYYIDGSAVEKPSFLESLSIFYHASITLLSSLNPTRIEVIEWPLGLFALCYRRLNSGDDRPLYFHLFDVNYQGIYDLNDFFLFPLDFRDKEQVEYAGSLNFLKAALVSFDKVIDHDESKDKLSESYLKEFRFDQ